MNDNFDVYDIFILLVTNDLIKYLNEINPFIELNTPLFNIECKKESDYELNFEDIKSTFNLITRNKSCKNILDYLSDLNNNANMFSIFGLKIILYYNLNCDDIDDCLEKLDYKSTCKIHMYNPIYINNIILNKKYKIEDKIEDKIKINNCSLIDLENTLIELFPKESDDINLQINKEINDVKLYENMYLLDYLNIIVDSDNNLISDNNNILIYKFLKLNPIKCIKIIDYKIESKKVHSECDTIIKSSNSLFSCEFDKWVDNCLACIDSNKLYTYISNKYKIYPINYNKKMINSKIISKTSDHLKEWLNNLK